MSHQSKVLRKLDDVRTFVQGLGGKLDVDVSEDDLGRCLNRWRRQAGLTQHELSDSTGLSIKTVNKLCNGHFSATQWQIVLRTLQAVGASVVVRGPDGQGHVLEAP